MGKLGFDKENDLFQDDPIIAPVVSAGKPGQVIKSHEIYDNTNYIPNTGLRLLDVPMHSSLLFQKMLWFHGAFDILYTILILGACFYKLMVYRPKEVTIIVASLKIIWLPLECFRLRFGYNGNINETFPELIAFLIFTSFFVIPISISPLVQWNDLFPHERCTVFINILFLAFELVTGCFVMYRFMETQSAAFFLRTAPLIDKTFSKKYEATQDIMSTREVQLGMQKFDKERDNMQPFKESD